MREVEFNNNKGASRMKEVNGYIISDSGSISVIIDGNSHTVAVDHVNYESIVIALKNKDVSQLLQLMDLATAIKEASAGKVAVSNGSIYYDGKEVINALTDRILRFIEEDLPFESMVTFLDNLMKNPSRTAIKELYLFLESNNMPITEDGHLLAYRRVNDNYDSFHPNPDGTHNTNKVGDIVSMERNEVDDVRDHLCSEGLHFCSLHYIPRYYGGSGRVMIVKINPANVVSIPSDFGNAKGRTCLYEVIAEHTNPEQKYEEYSESALVTSDGSEIDMEFGEGFPSDDEGYEFCEVCAEILGENESLLCESCQLEEDELREEQELLAQEELEVQEERKQSLGSKIKNVLTGKNGKNGKNGKHSVRDSKGRFTKKD